MSNKKSLLSGLFAVMVGVSSGVSAGLTTNVTLDFDGDDLTGEAMLAAVFPASGHFYLEEGMMHSAIGFGTTPGNSIGVFTPEFTSHVHGNSETSSRISRLEPDAGGGLFMLADGDPFSFIGFDLASFNMNLATSGTTSVTMRGYTSSDYSTFYDIQIGSTGGAATDGSNATDVNGDGLVFSSGSNGTRVDVDSVAEFGELYLLEYWFDLSGRGIDPASNSESANLLFGIDNAEFGSVATVPVPAAAYLFGSAVLGLFGANRKRRHTALV